MNDVFQHYVLPNGQEIKNRLVKAAMEENLANETQIPGEALFNLYQTWSNGGVGLIITGNVMIDHLAMTGPGGLVLEQDTDIKSFAKLASLAKQNDTKVWMQINHPGRQVFKKMRGKVLSPSDVALNMGAHSGLFSEPTPMSQEDIQDVIRRFVATAQKAQEAGFDGVEIHAAHGYLLSQFLSPLTNKRTDEWGGSIENRARLLLEVVTAIRQRVEPSFAVAVKLNSADFQRGGFDENDALQVVKMLEPLGVDIVELSGGSYEAPAMQGKTADARTLAREAYFLSFAEHIAKHTTLPIMTTGGIRRYSVANDVLQKGVDLVGMASALAMTPDLPNRWHRDNTVEGNIPVVTWKDKTLSGLATMAIVKKQLSRIGNKKNLKSKYSPLWALISDQIRAAKLTKRYRRRFQTEVN